MFVQIGGWVGQIKLERVKIVKSAQFIGCSLIQIRDSDHSFYGLSWPGHSLYRHAHVAVSQSRLLCTPLSLGSGMRSTSTSIFVSQCSCVPMYTLVVHNVALYWLGVLIRWWTWHLFMYVMSHWLYGAQCDVVSLAVCALLAEALDLLTRIGTQNSRWCYQRRVWPSRSWGKGQGHKGQKWESNFHNQFSIYYQKMRSRWQVQGHKGQKFCKYQCSVYYQKISS